MRVKLKLSHKLQIIIISVSIFVFAGSIGYIAYKQKTQAYENITQLINAKTRAEANNIKVGFNESMAVTRTLSYAFEMYSSLPKDQWQKLITAMYKRIFVNNMEFYQLWDSWELKYVDSTWTKPYGRIMNSIFREHNKIKEVTELRSLKGDSKLYARDKAQNKELISEIYADFFTEGKKDVKLMTTIESPINVNGKFIGLVGIDLTLDKIQKMVMQIKLKNLNGNFAFVLSHNGKLAGHPDSKLINTLAIKNPTHIKGFNIFKKIKRGIPFNIINTTYKEPHYEAYYPIKMGRTKTFWYLCISVPESSILKEVNNNIKRSLISGLVGLLILGFIIYIVARNITKPVQIVTAQLKNISKGIINIDDEISVKTGDEIEEMAEALKQSVYELNKKNQFAKHLGQGNLDYEYQVAGDSDELGKSLLEMQNSLVTAHEEEEIRKKEEEISSWIITGVAKINDILRENNQDLKRLTYDVLKFTLEYIEITQGGIYIRSDDEDEINYELISAIAYGRDKLIERKIKHEEGLVGRAAYEGLSISLTEIPEDYAFITSGLGQVGPRNILLVPIKSAQEVLGVIELLHLKEFSENEINLIEQIGNNLAATISNVRINQKTEKLLISSQNQTDDLARQEQEMRQNIEEMKATQEEARSRELEMNALYDAVNDIAYVAEFDMDGNFIDVNKNMEILLGKPSEQIIGAKQGSFSEHFDNEKFAKLWLKLKAGETVQQKQKVVTMSGEKMLMETFKPIMGEDSELYKVINIAINIS